MKGSKGEEKKKERERDREKERERIIRKRNAIINH